MERELKKVKLSMVMKEDRPRLTVSAYTTPVAGLVVVPRHVYIWKDGVERVVRRQNTWDIFLYPVGKLVLGGVPSKEQAVMLVNTRLAKYSWVALLPGDIEVTDEMRKDLFTLRKLVADMRKP